MSCIGPCTNNINYTYQECYHSLTVLFRISNVTPSSLTVIWLETWVQYFVNRHLEKCKNPCVEIYLEKKESVILIVIGELLKQILLSINT